jgi:hypothetical protein
MQLLRQLRQQQLFPQGLRISSFSSNAPGATAVLSVLPAHSLTQLHLDVRSSKRIHSRALAALSQLTSLHELHLWDADMEALSRAPGSCLTAIAQLRRLTKLELVGCWLDTTAATAAAQLRPLQELLSQPLPLQQLHLCVPPTCFPVLDLAQLSSLTLLVTAIGLPEGSVLPAQLQVLNLGYCTRGSQLAAELPLQELTSLDVFLGFEALQPLLQLARLTGLRQLALEYEGPSSMSAAAATAAAWGHLPQLKALRVPVSSNQQQNARLVSGVAAAT